MDEQRNDLLLDQTADVILREVFDVDHAWPAAPQVENKEGPRAKKRTWREAIGSLLGFRTRGVSPRADQP
jgi:hypothetical protein